MKNFPLSLPFDSADAAKSGDALQLFLAGEVIANIVKADLPMGSGIRILDQKGNGDRGATSAPKYLTALPA